MSSLFEKLSRRIAHIPMNSQEIPKAMSFQVRPNYNVHLHSECLFMCIWLIHLP